MVDSPSPLNCWIMRPSGVTRIEKANKGVFVDATYRLHMIVPATLVCGLYPRGAINKCVFEKKCIPPSMALTITRFPYLKHIPRFIPTSAAQAWFTSKDAELNPAKLPFSVDFKLYIANNLIKFYLFHSKRRFYLK